MVAAALAGGIFAERWLRLFEAEYLAPVGVLLLAAAIALRLGRDLSAILFALLGTALAGAFLLLHWRHQRLPDDIEGLVLSGRVELNEPARLTGWIADTELRRGRDEMYLLRLEQVESAQQRWTASGAVRLQHYRFEESEPRLELKYGDRVAALVRLRAVRGFHNPGGFDREARARREGVLYYAGVKAAELAERLPGRGGHWWMGALQRLRGALLARLDTLFPMNSPANGLLRAMLLGDRSGLDRRVSDDFQKTGAYHVLVVSGLNAVAVAAPLLLLLRLLRVPRPAATLVTIATLAVYVVLAGNSVPILRAAVMFSIYLLARLVYRDGALLNTIAASAILLLAIHPADLNDGGFQLSFFAVLLIAAIAVPLVDRTSAPYRRALEELDNTDLDPLLAPAQAQFRIELRMLRDALRDRAPGWFVLLAVKSALRFFDLVVVALVVQVGFLLPMAVYFHRAALVSVGANLMIVPIVGAVVALGMAALLLALISTAAAGLLAIPLAAMLETMMAIARWFAAFDLAALRVPAPPLWVAALFVAGTLGLAFGLAPGLAKTRALAAKAAAAGGSLALLIAASLIIWHPFPPRLPPAEVEITTLDVAQGDALVVMAPPVRVMLVDTGGLTGGEFATDTGEQIVSPYLWSRGIRRIDVLVLTHAHHDHIAGLESVLGNFRVGEIWLPAITDLEPYDRLARLAGQRQIPLRMHARGATAWIGDAQIAFLSPGAEYRPGRRAHNNDSLVMRLTYGNRIALLAGDIERRMEMELARGETPLRADWLKAPHHGSKTSNSLEFLSRVKAPYAVISVAANSPFGHPHPEALENLDAAGTRYFRTDRDGAVTWATDGNRVRLTTFEWQRPSAATDLW